MANEPRADSRDWTGNAKSAFVTLGASNHSANERQHHDFYATSPKAVEQLLALEVFAPNILEPCCGQGHIAKVLGKHGYKVTAQDLYDYGYGRPGVDFLKIPPPPCFYKESFSLKILARASLTRHPTARPSRRHVSAATVSRREQPLSVPLLARCAGEGVCRSQALTLRHERRFRQYER